MSEEKELEDQDIFTDEAQVDADNIENSPVAEEVEESPEVKLTQEVAELKDKYLRLMADFDNFRKRTAKERLDLELTASKNTLIAIIPVLDDFERAKKTAETEGSAEPFSEGVKLVYHKLISITETKGLKAMETQGESFDPEFHEAITEVDMGKEWKGKIVDTIERGYLLNNILIKHAKVVVGR